MLSQSGGDLGHANRTSGGTNGNREAQAGGFPGRGFADSHGDNDNNVEIEAAFSGARCRGGQDSDAGGTKNFKAE